MQVAPELTNLRMISYDQGERFCMVSCFLSGGGRQDDLTNWTRVALS